MRPVEYWRLMSQRFNAELADKSSALEMRLIAEFLDACKVMSADHFMERFATTLRNRVYLPKPLEETSIATLAHELQHVHQHFADPLFSIKYLADRTSRMLYECEAITAAMEVRHALGEDVPTVDEYVQALRGYGLGLTDIDAARVVLTWARKTVLLGGVTTAVGKHSVSILLPKCAIAGCPNQADPRWYVRGRMVCDGHPEEPPEKKVDPTSILS